jgi:hypothetical protein
VSTLRLLGRPIFGTILLLSAAATIAGCAGSQSGVTPQTSAQIPAQARNPLLPDAKCTHEGSVKVKPCSADFTTSNPGPTTVTVKAPKNDTVTESDNCGGATGVATVTQGEGDTWVVAAGATTGSCTATFSGTNKHDKGNGSAALAITNSV